jgi:hypothetical protein
LLLLGVVFNFLPYLAKEQGPDDVSSAALVEAGELAVSLAVIETN